MTDEESILRKAVLEDPDNDAPRLAYADWCEQQSDEPTKARAAFIRAQITLANHFDSLSYNQWFDAAQIEGDLRGRYSTDWAGRLVDLVDEYTFDRGFVELITISAWDFLDKAEELFALAPIRHLKLTEVMTVADRLFVSPYLDNIISIDLDRCGLYDAHLKMIAASKVLKHLKWLSVGENNLGLDGPNALAASGLSEQLVYVNFFGNPVDPGGQFSADNEIMMDSWLPEAGERLEAKHGYLKWLHREARTIYEAVPNRFRIA